MGSKIIQSISKKCVLKIPAKAKKIPLRLKKYAKAPLTYNLSHKTSEVYYLAMEVKNTDFSTIGNRSNRFNTCSIMVAFIWTILHKLVCFYVVLELFIRYKEVIFAVDFTASRGLAGICKLKYSIKSSNLFNGLHSCKNI